MKHLLLSDMLSDKITAVFSSVESPPAPIIPDPPLTAAAKEIAELAYALWRDDAHPGHEEIEQIIRKHLEPPATQPNEETK